MTPRGRVAPAKQCLDAHDRFALQVKHRLIDEEQLVGLKSSREIHLQMNAVL